ncbi:MAG TPA: hypothetical protein VMS01_04445 [Stellaceae bacterium]|nr:hypothetical protein [Stellaceae bacterium]
MRFTEHAILRRIARAAAAHAEATVKTHGRQSATGAELRRWLTVLDAWDATHAVEAGPLFEEKGEDDGRDG